MIKKRTLIVAGVAAVALGGVVGGVAIATFSSTVGGTEVRIDTRRSDSSQITSSQAFVPLSGAVVRVAVPRDATRHFTARFTAESSCERGGLAHWCSARVVARNVSTGTVSELYPRSGVDYAFDSVATEDFWEANALERSTRLGTGAYDIRVEWRTTSTSTVFRLDDWHFSVETNT